MELAKILLVALMAVAVSARPQIQTDLPLDANGNPFNPNPVYTYSFQVADDDAQTYIAKQENRDGDDVTGEYSYVDANGSLVTVRYTAGIMGYNETRSVQENFVTIRSRPAAVASTETVSTSSNSGFSSSGFSGNSGFNSGRTSVTTVQSTPAVRPITVQSTPAVTETVSTTSTSSADNSALIQRILAQLTPVIQNTISGQLSSGQTTTRRVTRPATVVRRVVPAAPAVVRTVTTSSSNSGSGISGIFGTGGANNIRFTNPDTSYDFEFDSSK